MLHKYTYEEHLQGNVKFIASSHAKKLLNVLGPYFLWLEWHNNSSLQRRVLEQFKSAGKRGSLGSEMESLVCPCTFLSRREDVLCILLTLPHLENSVS